MSCKIRDGVTETQFLEICFQVKEQLISKQPGFIVRHITRDNDGVIHMFIHWESIKDMETSQNKLAKEDLVNKFIGTMVIESITTSNLSLIQ